MSNYPDPDNPLHWIYNPDGTRTAKPEKKWDQIPGVTVNNNNNTYNMGDNSTVILGNGNTITNPNKSQKKSILAEIKAHLITHAIKYITATAITLVGTIAAVIKQYIQ